MRKWKQVVREKEKEEEKSNSSSEQDASMTDSEEEEEDNCELGNRQRLEEEEEKSNSSSQRDAGMTDSDEEGDNGELDKRGEEEQDAAKDESNPASESSESEADASLEEAAADAMEAFKGWRELVTARAEEARSLGKMNSPWYVTCEHLDQEQLWQIRWRKPWVEGDNVQKYLVNVVDDLGVLRQTKVKGRHKMVKIRWLKKERSYQAEVVAVYPDGRRETSKSVPIQASDEEERTVLTYRDERTGREFVKVPYMGKLYEVFAAKEVYNICDEG